MRFEFTAFPRATEGRGASRRMRRAGKAPGILYGGASVPQPIELDHNALIHALKNEAFHSSILSMSLEGAAQDVLLRDVQMHPFKRQILHVDFQRVDQNRKIHMKVPLHFIKGEESPAVTLSGAIVSHVLTELDIACLPKDLPEFIEVDLSGLALGQSIHVADLPLPQGVTAVPRREANPVVATAIVPRAIAETEETAPAAEAAAEVPAEAGKVAEKAGTDKAVEKGGDKPKKDDKAGKKDDKK
jgi:large subunit ribosomal protein L25